MNLSDEYIIKEQIESLVICPNCHSNIMIKNTEWICEKCKSRWLVDDEGIIYISPIKSFTKGWSSNNGISFDKRTLECLTKYIYMNNSYWNLNDNFKGKIILNVWSASEICIQIAESGAKIVFVVGSDIERMKISSRIAKSSNLSNIIFFFGDFFDLPIRNNSVDTIILLLLNKNDLEKSEIDAFSNRIKDLIGLKGKLWIIGKNKLNPIYSREDLLNLGMPLIRMNKEFLLFSFKKLTEQICCKMLFSKRGYLKFIEQLGFRKNNIHYIYYDYLYPLFIASTEDRIILKDFINQHKINNINMVSTIIAILAKTNKISQLSPYFLIECSNNEEYHHSGLQQFINQKYDNTDKIDYILTNNHGKSMKLFIYQEGRRDPLSVAKFGGPNNCASILKEYYNLKYNERILNKSHLIDALEIPAYLDFFNGNLYLLKPFKKGLCGEQYLRSRKFDNFDRTINFLRYITDWLMDYLSYTKPYHIYSRSGKEEFFKYKNKDFPKKFIDSYIDNENLFLAPSHGDLFPSNVIIGDSGISGIIDFEQFSAEDVFFRDFLHVILATSTLFFKNGLYYDSDIINRSFFEKNKYSREIAIITDKFCKTFEIEKNFILEYLKYIFD